MSRFDFRSWTRTLKIVGLFVLISSSGYGYFGTEFEAHGVQIGLALFRAPLWSQFGIVVQMQR
jgi:hypothetical protein